MRTINFTNKIFGRLRVIEQAPSKRDSDGTSIVYWKCICLCGKNFIGRGRSLADGKTNSCGCLRRDFGKQQGLKNYTGNYISAGINHILYKTKKRAIKMGISFELTKEQFSYFLFQSCYYCGDSFKSIWRNNSRAEKMRYNGIDRVDNLKGYTLDNCVTCCTQCNIAKCDYSLKEFFTMIKNVYERHVLEK